MRLFLIAAIAAASLAGASRADPVEDALAGKAMTCIHAEAPRVTALAQTLTEAVSFLVDDLCAVQIQHADAYATNSRMLMEWRATPVRPTIPVAPTSRPLNEYEKRLLDDASRSTTQLAEVTVNPETGELNTPPGFTPPLNPSSITSALRAGIGPHARYRALAAEAVLAAKGSPARR